MAPIDPSSFDDPALKDAVRRAWGGEVAPAALRQRVEAMGIGAASAPASAVQRHGRPRRGGVGMMLRHPMAVYGLAAAAMVVIGFSLASRMNEGPRGQWAGGRAGQYSTEYSTERYTTATQVLPASVAKGIVDVHDNCQKNDPDHRQFKDVPPDDYETLRQRLEKELGFPVLAAPLDGGEEGWDFRGGAICPIDHHRASHLVFVRKGQTVSVFSLPQASCPEAHGGQECEDLDPEHPLFVLVRPEGVHIIIGSSSDRSLSPAQLKRIGERLKPFLQRR